jgi:hypothetical protein
MSQDYIEISKRDSVNNTALGRIATISAAKRYVSYHTYLLHVLLYQRNPDSILFLGERVLK